MKTYKVQVTFKLSFPNTAVDPKTLSRQIKENFYLYPGKDTFFESKKGEYITTKYSKFEVSAKEVK